MKNTIAMLLLLAVSQLAFAGGGITDDACKLYVCLMGSSESDGGSDCTQRIQEYTNKFKGSCPDLPMCLGVNGGTRGAGPTTAGSDGNAVTIVSPENGQIIQVCVEEDTWWGTYCEIGLSAPATTALGVNYATCGGS